MNALVTGGAGFIGSNLVQGLVEAGHAVQVLDNLSTGYRDNIHPSAELLTGSITDPARVAEAVAGMDVVFHHAAHRAVLRSVENPLETDTANIHGTLIVLKAAADAGVRRVVSASSSSVYGGAERMPTPEDTTLAPRSPYAVTKLTGEHYCRVFAELYGLETVSLRYFNVYGPRQRPDSAYAAVIPLFIEALASGTPPLVHGDGEQSRDFTYITDVVAANMAAATAPASQCSGRAYNIAGGKAYSLLQLLDILGEILDVEPKPEHAGPRAGDVRHTRADIAASERDLGHIPEVSFEEGLRRTVEWFSAR